MQLQQGLMQLQNRCQERGFAPFMPLAFKFGFDLAPMSEAIKQLVSVFEQKDVQIGLHQEWRGDSLMSSALTRRWFPSQLVSALHHLQKAWTLMSAAK